MQPSDAQTQIHLRAVRLSRARRRADGELARAVRQVFESNAHRAHGQSTLFKYCVRELGLCEWEAYAFGNVAKRGSRIPALASAVESGRLALSKAARIVSTITETNADELVTFAVEHSTDEINREVARLNPKAARRERAKHLDEDSVELLSVISRAALKKLDRVRSLEGQRGRSTEIGAALEAALDVYLEKQDPVRKAERAVARAEARRARQAAGPRNAGDFVDTKKSRRQPRTAAQNHSVSLRDRGGCMHVDQHGKRCGSDRFLEVHHITPVSRGGTNDPSNLITLCSECHDMIHQMSFGIDHGVSWLCAPTQAYVADAGVFCGRGLSWPGRTSSAAARAKTRAAIPVQQSSPF